MVMDFRYAIRTLVKARAVTAIAVVALALGIGANTAIFSVVKAVLLNPLPYREPDRIVSVLQPDSGPIAAPDFTDIRIQARSFERAAAVEAWSASLTGRDNPEQIVGMHVTEDLFPLLGVAAIRGRTFDVADFTPGKDHVLVISHGLWQRAFGGGPDIAGMKVLLDGDSYTIVGVMPAEFFFAPFWVTQAEMWAPLDLATSIAPRGGGSLRMFARLASGVSKPQAQAEMNQIASTLAAAYPQSNTGYRLLVDSIQHKATGSVRPALELMLAMVAMVLLIACANVANLALARATARRKEIAVRLALGAPRSRIARQVLIESVMLSIAGAALGLMLARWAIVALEVLLRPDGHEFRARLIGWDRIALDVPVLLFTLGLGLATGVLFGLAPAFAAARGDVNDALKDGTRGSTSGRGFFRRTLAGAEIATALVLLTGAGLLMRSFVRLRSIDPGFDARNVVTMTISVAGRADLAGASRETLYRTVLDRAAAVPGVIHTSMINHLPIAGDQWGFNYWVERQALPDPGKYTVATYRACRPGYFATMRAPVLAGREFTDQDTFSSPRVVIVNEALARLRFGGGSAIGHRIAFGDPRRDPKWMTIVGVVHDVAQSWGNEPRAEVYVPYAQDPLLTASTKPFAAYMTLVVRTNADADSQIAAIKNAVWSVDRNLPLTQVQTLEHAIGNAMWQPRFSLLLSGLFAMLALALAMIGIYGVMAYEIAQRTQEIGIRMALGAGRGGIARMIAAQSLPMTMGGIVCGILGAAGLARVMRGMLYQMDAIDPVTFTAVPMVILAVAAVAAIVPARRAMNVDPMTALRNE
jgi:predicted permease